MANDPRAPEYDLPDRLKTRTVEEVLLRQARGGEPLPEYGGVLERSRRRD